MKTQKTCRIGKWTLRVSQLLVTMIAFMSFSSQASAIILFQDDDFHDIDSEGVIINADDGGDEDVTLQLGNDGTDATILFDDGTGDITFSTTGGDFDFSDDNITTTGTTSTGGITSTGAVDFSGASSFLLYQGAANPGTCTEGELFYNTTDNTAYVCTAANTWTAQASGAQDFESVYGADGDNTLTTAAFDIDATGAVGIDSDAGLTLGGSTITVNSDGGAVSLNNNVNQATSINTGTSTGAVSIGGGSGTVAVNSTSWDISSTGVGSGFTGFTTSGTVSLGDNTGTVTVNSSDWDISATGDMTGIGAITMNGLLTGTAGATISGATTSINDSSNFATSINTGTSTGAVSIGGGSGTVAINSTSWDVSTTGVASGFTGITSTGTINFSGASEFRIREVADESVAVCTTVNELVLDTTENIIYVCTVIGSPGTWVSVASGGDADTLDTLDSTQFLRADVSDSWGDGVGSEILTFGDGTNGDSLTFAANSILNVTNATITGLNASSVNYDGTNVDTALGTRTFTEDNVVTDDASFTANVDALDLKWGDLASTVNTEGASLVGVEDSGTNFIATDVEGVLAEIAGQIGSNANNVDTMVFEPEYPNYVLFGDGTSNSGKMEALYDNTNGEQYYRWTSKKNAQHDYDIRFRYTLPDDYAAAGNMTLRLRTDTITAADNTATVIVRNDTNNATCHSDAAATGAVAGTWETITITGAEIETGCTAGSVLDPGDVIEVQIKMMANDSSSGGTDVGTLAFVYTN